MLQLALQGYSNQQIATALNIQKTTVNNRFKSIFAKLKVKTRRKAIVWYRRDHMIRAFRPVDPSTYIPDSKETRLIDEATPLDEYMETPLPLKHTR